MATHWQDIQEKTFTRWVNQQLAQRGMHVDKLPDDFKDGILLCNLIEVISGDKSVGRINRHPRVPAQKLENVQMALDFVRNEGIRTVNIGPEDFVDGRLKLVLGFVWTLILRYQINLGDVDNDLLRWVQSKIPEYNITGFKKDWNDGRALCALIDALRPGMMPGHREMDPSDKEGNCRRGIEKAYDELDVAQLIRPDEMANPRVDQHAMMTYISQFRNLADRDRAAEDEASRRARNAAKCRAYGDGLTEGVANEEGRFVVETPGTGKLEVRVEGPANDARAVVKDVGGGKYEVSYTPTVPGTWKVHVTLDGVHIPGSVFTVNVLEEESLGGEGKFRVFFSTTASSGKGRKDVFDLQSLLESKRIHERPDFEPWIAVDLMERDDREAVFRKAGTRALPIVIIDDVVVGDYDAIVNLNESGVLDKILSHGIAGAGREYLRDKSMFGGGAAVPSGGGKRTVTTTPSASAPASRPAAAAPAAAGGAKKFCGQCGGKLAPGAKFCSGCGTRV